MTIRERLASRLFGDLINQRVTEAEARLTAQADERVREALSVGLHRPDDLKMIQQGYRQLTTGGLRSIRELPPLAQDQMLRIVNWLRESNPLAEWLLNTTVDFTLGEGFRITSEHPEVQKILDAFVDDPVNQLDQRFDRWAMEFGMYGELCLPAFTNYIDGHVRLGYIDPFAIDHVVTDPDNVLIRSAVVLKKPHGVGKSPVLKVIREDTSRISPTYGLLMPALPMEVDPQLGVAYDGSCFLFQTNHVSNATRGRSDLLPLIDWLDGYDQFLFDSLDTANLFNSFVYDLQIESATEAQIKEKLATLRQLRKGQIYGHNEKEKLTAITPDLKAQDKNIYLRDVRGHIVGSKGFPEHWYGLGGDVNFACHAADTELLTDRGWVPFPQVTRETVAATMSSTGDLQYEPVLRVHDYAYDGDLIRFAGRRYDVMVTPNHRMLARQIGHDRFEMVRADQIARSRWFFKQALRWTGKEQDTFWLPGVTDGLGRQRPPAAISMDDWLTFVGYVVSEGSVRTTPQQHRVSIAQKKPAVAAKIATVISRLPFRAGMVRDADGTMRWQIYDVQLARYVRDKLGASSLAKTIPREYLNLPRRQLRLLFDALMDGDGSWCSRPGLRTSGIYYTISQILADQVQELAFKLGYSASIGAPDRIGLIPVHIRKANDAAVNATRAGVIQREPYVGRVYCVEVPNGVIITRRNGKIGIHGNSAKEMGLPPVKRLTKRQKELRQILGTMLRYQLHAKVQAGALAREVVIGRVAGDGSSKGTSVKVEKAFAIEMPELSMRDTATIVAAVTSLTAALAQAVDRGWIRPETAAKLYAAQISQLGVEVDASKEYTPGAGPGGATLNDYSPQNLQRILAQLGRIGNGNGDNVLRPKQTTPVGGDRSE